MYYGMYGISGSQIRIYTVLASPDYLLNALCAQLKCRHAQLRQRRSLSCGLGYLKERLRAAWR